MSDTDEAPFTPATQRQRGLARLLADVRPLRESPEFRRLWAGGTLSGIGGRITATALPIQVYSIAHTSLAVGLIGLALAIPLIAVGLVGGAVIDAVDRRKLVLVTTSLMALVSLGLCATALLAVHSLWPLYGLAAAESCLFALDAPARQTFLPRLLPPGRIPAATALLFLSFHIGLIAGPLLAGAIIAGPGLATAYAVDAFSFVFSLYGVARLRAMRADRSGAATGVGAVIEGFAFARRQRILLTALLADLNATVFGMPFALFPALAATHFGGGPRTVGVLYASPAVGGFLAAIFSGPLSSVRRQGLALLLATVIWGAAIAGFGLSPALLPAVVLLALAGAADVVNGVFRYAIIQSAAPDALRGRINSLGFVIGTGGPRMGDVEAGIVATLTSPAISAVSGGILCLVGAGIIALSAPALVRYRSPYGEQRDAVS